MIRANTLIKKHLWSLLVCITMMMTTLPISGQERYKVAWFNSQEITIGGKKIAQGMEFDSRAKVVFSDESQAFRAVDIKTKKCKVFSNHKIQNPRYAGHTKGLSTKIFSWGTSPLLGNILIQSYYSALFAGCQGEWGNSFMKFRAQK